MANSVFETLIPQTTDTERDLLAKICLTSGSFYNARAYGATGDGTTDDTDAIQAAIDAAAAAGGGTVFLPKGTYLVTGGVLRMKPRVHLKGEASNFAQANGAQYQSPTMIECEDSAGPIITIDGLDALAAGMPVQNNAITLGDGSIVTSYQFFGSISDLGFSCNSHFADVLRFKVMSGFHVHNVSFRGVQHWFARVWASNVVGFWGVRGQPGIGGGIFLDRTADCIIEACEIFGGDAPVVLMNGGNKNLVIGNMLGNTRDAVTDGTQLTFTADAGTDLLTATGHGIVQVGEAVTFETTGTLPAPLQPGKIYYVLAVDEDRFVVNSQYEQGVAGGIVQEVYLDITDAGTGTHTVNIRGPRATVALNECFEADITGNRMDQSFEAALAVWNSQGVTAVGNMLQEAGFGNASYTGAVVRCRSMTYSTITGNRIAQRGGTAYAVIGITLDSSSHTNWLVGNAFDAGITTQISAADVDANYIPLYVWASGAITWIADGNAGLRGTGSGGAVYNAYGFSATAGTAPQVAFLRGGGTKGSPSQALSGHKLGGLIWGGRGDAGDVFSLAEVFAELRENLTATTGGTLLSFQTCPTGSVAREEVGRMDSAYSSTATSFSIRYGGALKRVEVGAADSGGAGYRMLRIAN